MPQSSVQLEIISHVLGSMKHCAHCQMFIDGVGVGGQVKQVDLDSYPPEFMADWQRLSDWVLALTKHYPDQLIIKITDAQSPQGLWLALRHGIRRYPTFILAGEKYRGWESESALMARLQQLLAESNRA